MEGGNGLVPGGKGRANPNDAVIQIAETEEDDIIKQIRGSQSSSKNIELSFSNFETTELQPDHSYRNQQSRFTGSASPDKPAESPSGQSLTRRKSSARSMGPLDSNDAKFFEASMGLEIPMSPKLSFSRVDKEEYKHKISRDNEEKKKQKTGKMKKTFMVIELIAFVCVMGLLIASFIVNILKNHYIWELKLWKWCVFVLVIICGQLVTKWLMIVLIYLIEKNFKLKLMVLYYVDGLRNSARVFIWLGMVLLTWGLLFEIGVERSKEAKKIIHYITRGLVACLVGTVLWMVKTYSFKMLVASRLSKRFFDQIQEAMFDEYVISTISGPPLMEIMAEFREENDIEKEENNDIEKQKEEEEMIHVSGIKQKRMKKISAWTMEKLINHICSTKLSRFGYESWDEEVDDNRTINSEWEAMAAAYGIFRNVAQPGCKYIDEDDLLRFFEKAEVEAIMQKFGEGTGRVRRSDVKKWVVNVYEKRTSVAHYLNNSKEAMRELNRLFTGIVIVLIIIVWLLIVGLLTTKVLVLILSQLLLAVFLFGNTAKNMFEAIIFLFVTHPFDVGDRCVIDGVQMVVEEMHILTTTFLRYDNEKIFYPNSVLATKPISNYHRSTVDMRDAVEFAIDVFTPFEKIGCLKDQIRKYLEQNSRNFSPKHSVVVKQIKDGKMIMGLYVTHIIIFENYEEKINRRSELVLELMKIFEHLCIRVNHVIPQEVHVSYVGSTTTSAVPPQEN